MKPLYISFYTPRYAATAAGLIESLDRHRLDYRVVAVPEFESWQVATRYKPELIRETMAVTSRPLIWIDADARVVQYPTLLDELPADTLAMHTIHGQAAAGLVYFGNTPSIKRLVDNWIVQAILRPTSEHGDQDCLADALAAWGAYHELPPEYCWIDDGNGGDISETLHGKREPVIVQRQASRRLRH